MSWEYAENAPQQDYLDYSTYDHFISDYLNDVNEASTAHEQEEQNTDNSIQQHVELTPEQRAQIHFQQRVFQHGRINDRVLPSTKKSAQDDVVGSTEGNIWDKYGGTTPLVSQYQDPNQHLQEHYNEYTTHIDERRISGGSYPILSPTSSSALSPTFPATPPPFTDTTGPPVYLVRSVTEEDSFTSSGTLTQQQSNWGSSDTPGFIDYDELADNTVAAATSTAPVDVQDIPGMPLQTSLPDFQHLHHWKALHHDTPPVFSPSPPDTSVTSPITSPKINSRPLSLGSSSGLDLAALSLNERRSSASKKKKSKRRSITSASSGASSKRASVSSIGSISPTMIPASPSLPAVATTTTTTSTIITTTTTTTTTTSASRPKDGLLQSVPRIAPPHRVSGPLPASLTTTQDKDENGIPWVVFEYTKDRVKKQYKIRCDIDSVDVSTLDTNFKLDNCIYPRAAVPPEEYKGNRQKYETECNSIGWRLSHLNPIIRNQRGLIQRAVDFWRNTNSDISYRSRRVKRISKSKSLDVETSTSDQPSGNDNTSLVLGELSPKSKHERSHSLDLGRSNSTSTRGIRKTHSRRRSTPAI